MEEHLEHVVEECGGFDYGRADGMAIPVLQSYVYRNGGDPNSNRSENATRAAETDAGYDSDGSAALVCVPVRKG